MDAASESRQQSDYGKRALEFDIGASKSFDNRVGEGRPFLNG